MVPTLTRLCLSKASVTCARCAWLPVRVCQWTATCALLYRPCRARKPSLSQLPFNSNDVPENKGVSSGWILLWLPRLPKLPSRCYSNRPGNLDNLGSNDKVQPQSVGFKIGTDHWWDTIRTIHYEIIMYHIFPFERRLSNKRLVSNEHQVKSDYFPNLR